MQMESDVNFTGIVKQEDHRAVSADVSFDHQPKPNNRKRKFRSKTRLKKQSAEELPKLKLHHRPHPKQNSSKPLNHESPTRMKESQALNNLKLLSMQLESSPRRTPVNEFESIFSDEFRNLRADSKKKEFRDAIRKELSSIIPSQNQVLRTSRQKTLVTETNPLTELSGNNEEEIFQRKSSRRGHSSSNYYDFPPKSKPGDTVNGPQLFPINSSRTNPRVNRQSVLKEHSENLQNFSFSAHNSLLEDPRKMFTPSADITMNSNNILAFNILSHDSPKAQQQGQRMPKFNLKIPSSDLATPMSHSHQELEANETFKEPSSLSSRNMGLQNRCHRMQSKQQPRLEESWEQHYMVPDLKSEDVSLNQLSTEMPTKENSSVDCRAVMKKSPSSRETSSEQKRFRNGLFEPFYQRVHTKLQKMNAKDTVAFQKPPIPQKSGPICIQPDSLCVHGSQSLNWYNLPEKSINSRRSSSIKTPKLEEFSQQQNTFRNKENVLPKSLTDINRYEEPKSLRNLNTEGISQSTQVENSYLQMLSKQCSVVKEEEESIHSPIKITDQNIVSQIEGKTPELSMKKAITPHPLPPLFLPQLLGKTAVKRGRDKDSRAKSEKRKTRKHEEPQGDFRMDHLNFIGMITSEESLESFKKNLTPIVFAKNVGKMPIKPPKKLYI